MSVCHDCVVEKDSLGMRYQGESPDEITLVDTAHRMGYTFISNSQDAKMINMFGSSKNTLIK